MISFEQISKTQFASDCPTGDYDKIKLPVRATDNSAGRKMLHYCQKNLLLSQQGLDGIPMVSFF